MNLELRWKSCICLNIYSRGYIQVIPVCVSLRLQRSSILCWRDWDDFGTLYGALSFLSWRILYGNDLCFWMSTANAVTPQTDYLKCYVLHLHTHLLSAQGRLKLHQVGQINQGLLTSIAFFWSCLSAFWGQSKYECYISLKCFWCWRKERNPCQFLKFE